MRALNMLEKLVRVPSAVGGPILRSSSVACHNSCGFVAHIVLDRNATSEIFSPRTGRPTRRLEQRTSYCQRPRPASKVRPLGSRPQCRAFHGRCTAGRSKICLRSDAGSFELLRAVLLPSRPAASVAVSGPTADRHSRLPARCGKRRSAVAINI